MLKFRGTGKPVKRRSYNATEKSQYVLEMVSGKRSPAQIQSETGIAVQILNKWKSQFLSQAHLVFDGNNAEAILERRIAELERLLGKQALELEIAKKALSLADFQKLKGGL